MRIVKDTQQEEKKYFTNENRFIKISDIWYELLSVHVDVITEKVILNFNVGSFDEDDNFIQEKKYRGIIENKDEKQVTIKEKLPLNKNSRISTTYKITDFQDISVYDESKKKINYFNVIDKNTIAIKGVKSGTVDVKYKSKEEFKDRYSKFMREICSRTTLAKNIIISIRRVMASGDVRYEEK